MTTALSLPQVRRGGRRGPRMLWQRRRLPWLPLAIIAFVLVLPALLAPLITVHDPLRGVLGDRLLPPVWQDGGTWTYPLGTDKQGRDVLTRLVYGARISLLVSTAAIVVGALVGTTLGLVAGYFGGFVDKVIGWLVDTFQSLPMVLFALVVVAAIGPSFVTIIAIISATIWAVFARLVRGETLSVRESAYVARARVAGASAPRILLRHVLPNVANSLVVMATLQVGVVILEEASLSFIGAGIPRPQPSWGIMVADGREQLLSSWWLSFFPGVAILVVVLSLNLVGDWLRDYLDPKLRQQV
ncbi:ABC transporter permease [Phytohabitans suffuscus]|uniref:Peptide ABC transporter permease n=1 Tax=Phytohabitans suffuscus TaxID=624315 RepID=A0A6F8Z0M2_9ACTN|nr:ABC transporter permease [Phytohabitans suffuscus]BCB91866.1 peptide ABC transporter permease [Phytohabitans suffuscus]